MRFGDRRTCEMALMVVAASGGTWLGYAAAAAPIEERRLPAHLADAGTPPLEIRIFDDFECPACDRFDDRAGGRLRQLERDGRIVLRYYHAPRATHTRSINAAAAVACIAGPDRPRARQALHRDKHWLTAADPASAAAAAVDRGAADHLAACMRSDSIRVALEGEADFARQAGIHRVPTVWVGDRHINFRSYRALLRYVEARAR